MSRFRRRPIVLAVIALFGASAGLLLAQGGPAGPTAHDLTRWLVAGGSVTVLGGLIALWRWATGAIVGEAVSAALKLHNDDELAHRAAAEHNHRGMEAKLDSLAEAIAALARTVDALVERTAVVSDMRHAVERLVAEHELITGIKSGKPLGRCIRATDTDADLLALLRQRVEAAEQEKG